MTGAAYSFDKAADLYERTREVPRSVLSRLALLMRRETRGPWLDVGVGTGRTAIPLADAGADVTGIDVAPSMLARLRAAAPSSRVRLVRGDMRRLPFAVGAFAGAIGYHVLHLVDEPASLLREIARACRPGAPLYWLSDVPERPGIFDRMKARYAELLRGRHPFGKPSSRDLAFVQEALSRLGLSGEEVRDGGLSWDRSVAAAELLDLFRGKGCSALFSVPDVVHASVMDELEPWAARELPTAEVLRFRIRAVRVTLDRTKEASP